MEEQVLTADLSAKTVDPVAYLTIVQLHLFSRLAGTVVTAAGSR
jgi:hypothetical protein